jgi:hypothetical protein
MKRNPEEYQNLIELLKQALLFYGKKENYEPDSDLIDKDKGHQARFALEKIKEFSENTEKLEQEFMEQISEAVKNNESDTNILALIEEYKQIKNVD